MPKYQSFPAWPQNILVTRPNMPNLEEYTALVNEIWSSKWLTNCGQFHRSLEAKVAVHTGCPHVNLVNNGTMALILALAILDLEEGGEIITTPFTFPASTHCIDWMGYTPVFADIDPVTGNICPDSVAQHITDKTRCVMGVHVFGTPCDHTKLEHVCATRNIPIVYDAAHAFDVTVDGKSILAWGNASATSFHATKLFSTVEGGAVFVNSADEKIKIDQLKNFGILNENLVLYSGLNMKLSELHAAFGLLLIDHVDEEIKKRNEVAEVYLEGLKDTPGITIITNGRGFEPNWAYFSILIDEEICGTSRDEIYEGLKHLNVFARRYFYPLTSRVEKYSALPSASLGNLPVAHKWEEEVLCLPIYGNLEISAAQYIVKAITYLLQ